VVKSEAPSLGRLPVPHSRHSTVELAIGTLRHHLLPMVRTGAPFPDRAVAVLPFAPSALVRGSMVGYSKRSHRHLLVLPVVGAEVPAGGLTGASARSKIAILLVWLGPCAELV
jgi:hypothetical protein